MGYYPAINVGDMNNPVAAMVGKVEVTYGDCCSFRLFSQLYFSVNASTGYTENYFDDEK